MAVCPEGQSGYQYLKAEDAAICVDDGKQILPVLRQIIEHPEMVERYREKAWKCGYMNHEKVRQQRQLLEQLERIAEEG